jgi:hypothetical protein
MWAGVGMMHRDNVSAFENFMLLVLPLIVIAIIIVFIVLAIKLGHRIATLKCKPTTLAITSIASLIVPITATAVITYLMRGSWAIFFVLIPSMPLIISSILALTRLSQYKTYYGKQKTSKKK